MYKKLAILIGSIITVTTAFAEQNLIITSANTDVDVYCAPHEVSPDYKGVLFLVVPGGNKPVEKSLTDIFKLSQGEPVGCNMFYKNILLGNFGFVLEKSGWLSVGSAGLLVDTDYRPKMGMSAPDIYVSITFASKKH